MYVSEKFMSEVVYYKRVSEKPKSYRQGDDLPADAVNDAEEPNSIFDDITPDIEYSQGYEDDDEVEDQGKGEVDIDDGDDLFSGTYPNPADSLP